MSSNRREFLESIGRGMLVAGLGTTLTTELGFSTAFADEGTDALALGNYAGLVRLMQDTPADKLQPVLVQKLTRGEVDLKTLVAAGALANAETFGGQDYVGFHTAMAMLPSLSMAELLPTERRALPVLKVLYRNSDQIQQLGGASHKTLMAIHIAEHAEEHDLGEQIKEAARKPDYKQGEELFSKLGNGSMEQMLNALQPAVQDDINVHRFVFAHRTFGLAKLLGKEYAHTILRQCVRFCCHHEEMRIQHKSAESPIRTVMPKLMDQYKLQAVKLGKRDPGDEWVDRMSQTIYNGPAPRAAEAVAAALAEGIDPEVVGEAISLASNLLLLRQSKDLWRTHGDSRGIHSTDATNAWRNMARVTDTKHAVTGLIVAAYHSSSHQPFNTEMYPLEEHRAMIKAKDAKGLLDEADDAVRHNDQGRAAAAIQIYGEQGHPVEGAFDRLLKFAISEDGRLHGEKYFYTVGEEFKTVRPAFRWRHVVGLARATASAYGYNRQDKSGFRAPGYEEACKLLKVEA